MVDREIREIRIAVRCVLWNNRVYEAVVLHDAGILVRIILHLVPVDFCKITEIVPCNRRVGEVRNLFVTSGKQQESLPSFVNLLPHLHLVFRLHSAAVSAHYNIRRIIESGIVRVHRIAEQTVSHILFAKNRLGDIRIHRTKTPELRILIFFVYTDIAW